MAEKLSEDQEALAMELAKRNVNVLLQQRILELEKEIYYQQLIETKYFLQKELKTATGEETLDGWIVCGTGLASLPDANGVKVLHHISAEKIPHWFVPQAPGHGKEVIFANIQGQLVGIATGRAHLYDTNFSPEQLKMITAPLVVAKGLGVEWLVTTNAAGVNDNGKVKIGDMVADVDYVNQPAINSLYGPNDERLGHRFPSKAATADPELFARLANVIPAENLHTGVYTLASNAPLYEGYGDLLRGSYDKLTAQNPDLAELHGMSFAQEAIVLQHFNNPSKSEDGFDRQIHWIGLTAATNIIPTPKAPTKEALLAASLENPNPTSEAEVLEGAKDSEGKFIPAIINLAASITKKPFLPTEEPLSPV